MWHFLIVIVAAGHIYQFRHTDGFPNGYRNREDCEMDLRRLPHPRKGVQVITMECRESDPALNYHPWEEE